MKLIYCVVALYVCLLSCKKGKTLSHPVAVQFVKTTSSGVYPEDYFPPFDPLDPTESSHLPNYARNYSPEQIAERFNSKLASCLNKNNILLQDDSTAYVLVITGMNLSESLHRESYTDSCSYDYAINYVYYSSLKFSIHAELYKNGILLAIFSEEGNSRDSVKSKTDACNAPKIRHMFRTTPWLVDQVAKELRVQVSKKIYELEE